ncbi:thioesterase domain-containing protein [Methylocella sp.]|uniref:thioesterase domain-containing protein n=1 Tax=Methylocella sp. TaxID=1978226 RepID=UPI003783FF8D
MAVFFAGESIGDRPSLLPDDPEELIGKLWDEILERGPQARAASLLDLKLGVQRIHRLFGAITELTGVALPITTMFEASTIPALAEIVRRGEAPPQPVAVLVQPHEGGTPLFLFPGLGGIILELYDLGRLVRAGGPVYANLTQRLDGRGPLLRSVVDMARVQADAIRAIQPHGPYRLAGFSLGGLIALETARLLAASGERVEFLGLIEPNLPERFWPPAVKRAFLLRRLKTHFDTLRALPPRQILSYLGERAAPLARRLRRLTGGAGTASASPYTLANLPKELADARDAGLAAFYAYEIKPYAGRAAIFESAGGDPLSCPPTDVFPPYLGGYDRFACGGDHASLMRQPFVGELADRMSDALGALNRG